MCKVGMTWISKILRSLVTAYSLRTSDTISIGESHHASIVCAVASLLYWYHVCGCKT